MVAGALRRFGIGLLMVPFLAAAESYAQTATAVVATPTPTPQPSFASPSDMVFDSTGNNLYITSGGWIWRYDLPNDALQPAFEVGGTLNAIDIAPDDSFVLVAQDDYTPTSGRFQRVKLATGEVTDIVYSREVSHGEGGAWDVAIASNGFAFGTTRVLPDWVSSTPLREIDLTTNQIIERAPVQFGEVSDGTSIERNADHTRVYFLGTTTGGEVFSYDAVTDTFVSVPGSPFSPSYFFWKTLAFGSAAVNRTGTLLGLRINISASLYNSPDYSEVHKFDGISGGVAFDAVRDRFYGVNAAKDVISGFNTMNFSEEVQIPIGEDVPPVLDRTGVGKLVASPDGRYLALSTKQHVLVFDVTNAPPPPSPTPTPTPGPAATPSIAVTAGVSGVFEGDAVSINVSAQPNSIRPVAVNYAFSGKAAFGSDYTLSDHLGQTGQILIPVGVDTVSFTLTAIQDGVTEKPEKLLMKILPGPGYKPVRRAQVKLKLFNRG